MVCTLVLAVGMHGKRVVKRFLNYNYHMVIAVALLLPPCKPPPPGICSAWLECIGHDGQLFLHWPASDTWFCCLYTIIYYVAWIATFMNQCAVSTSPDCYFQPMGVADLTKNKCVMGGS